QHPATHGVLRLLIRLDGETIVSIVPDMGYLHRGYEKIAENCTYHEFIPHTDRLDYLSPLANNVAYVLAVEKLAGIEIPARAQYMGEETASAIKVFLDDFPKNLDECERLLIKNRIFIDRCEGVGYISRETATNIGMTGPALRAAGVEHDLRRDEPYLVYPDLD